MIHPFSPSVGLVHFIGIGGLGMCPLAFLMQRMGYQVQGSHIDENDKTQQLQEAGTKVFIGHKAENIRGAKVIVATMAVTTQNPEIAAASAAGIPIVHRAEMLSELMRNKKCIAVAGTHGKSSTTALISCILDHAKFDPTVVNGAKVKEYGSNFKHGEGDWMVVETDESDGSFTRLSPQALIGVVTNIDNDHHESWPNIDREREGFAQFVAALPFYGVAVVGIDDPQVKKMIKMVDRQLIKYGLSEEADVRAKDVDLHTRGCTFAVDVRDRQTGSLRTIESIHLPMFGEHNVQNATAAIAVATEMGIDDATIKAALAKYKGLDRRFNFTGEVNGITIINDYAHHPNAIAVNIKAAKQCGAKNVYAVFETGSERGCLLEKGSRTCFQLAKAAFVTEPNGRFSKVELSTEKWMEILQSEDQSKIVLLEGEEGRDKLPQLLVDEVISSGDFVICFGYRKWMNDTAYSLADSLRKLL